MKKILSFILLLLAITSCTTVLSEKDIDKLDERNEGINIIAEYKSIFDHHTLVFNVNDIDGEKSRVDVFRCVLQSAEKLKDQSFDKVEFAYKGKSKMYINGKFFKKLGDEYSYQNHAYTIRTFPEHVYNCDGEKAFSEWTGGILGVLTRQMEDFATFHNKWYLNDLTIGE